jgi:hypothetical protein
VLTFALVRCLVQTLPQTRPNTRLSKAKYATKKAIDLTKGNYNAYRKNWMQRTDCSHCQALAETARAAKIEVICYASVRDPATD